MGGGNRVGGDGACTRGTDVELLLLLLLLLPPCPSPPSRQPQQQQRQPEQPLQWERGGGGRTWRAATLLGPYPLPRSLPHRLPSDGALRIGRDGHGGAIPWRGRKVRGPANLDQQPFCPHPSLAVGTVAGCRLRDRGGGRTPGRGWHHHRQQTPGPFET